MVVRSTVNWTLHKEGVYDFVLKRYGAKRANRFINHYKSRYDTFGRSFIDYKLAFWLLDDYYYVNRVGTRWYACVGIGGTGKTTVMKNIMYFLDDSFDIGRVNLNTKEFIRRLYGFQRIGSMKSCFMDEPDDTIHVTSNEGKMLREILGKMRQQKLFLGICATDLKDIPPYIFRKLNGIFFLPYLGKGMFFKDKPRKGIYVLQKIREDYSKKGYKVFFELKNSKGCLNFKTHVATPLSQEEEKKYLKDKENDYTKSMEKFIKIQDQKDKGLPIISQRDQIIIDARKKGLTQEEIAKVIGVSRQRIGKILELATSQPEQII